MSKVKKKRVGFVLDMTPLVDITFLLLTFFMFTAKFKSESEENQVVIKRPKTSADTTKVPENNLALLKIGIDSASKDTAYYFSMVNEQDIIGVREKLRAKGFPDVSDNQVTYVIRDTTWLETVVEAARFTNLNVKFAVDADSAVSYRWIEQAMNSMRKKLATQFYFVTDKQGG